MTPQPPQPLTPTADIWSSCTHPGQHGTNSRTVLTRSLVLAGCTGNLHTDLHGHTGAGSTAHACACKQTCVAQPLHPMTHCRTANKHILHKIPGSFWTCQRQTRLGFVRIITGSTMANCGPHRMAVIKAPWPPRALQWLSSHAESTLPSGSRCQFPTSQARVPLAMMQLGFLSCGPHRIGCQIIWIFPSG